MIFVAVILLAMYYYMDVMIYKKEDIKRQVETESQPIRVEGAFNFISEGLENCLREVKQSSAKEIVKFIIKKFFSRVPEPDDDVTIVVVKKN